MKHPASWQDLCLVALLALEVLRLFVPVVAASRSSWVIADDMRQQVAPFVRIADPAAVPRSVDLLTEYALAYVPLGYGAVFAAASRAIDPVSFAKLVGFTLHAATLLLLLKLGADLTGRLAGGALLALWMLHLGFPFVYTAGGLPRSFATPIALLWLVGACSDPPRALFRLVAILAASLFFPLALVPIGLAESMFMLRSFATNRDELLRRLAPTAGAFAIAATVALVQMRRLAMYGPAVTWTEARAMPELHPGGRFAVFPLPSALTEITQNLFAVPHGAIVGGSATPGGVELLTVFGILLLPLAGAERSARRSPVLMLLIASIAAYFAARFFAYRLYVPNRMLIASSTIGGALAITGYLGAVERVGARVSRDVVLWFAAILLLSTLATGGWLAAFRRHGGYTIDRSGSQSFFQAIARLPPGALLAGPIREVDDVPLLGHRPVLVSDEMTFAIHLGYYETVRRRLVDLTTAYFARDRSAVRDFAVRYGVDYMIVAPGHYVASGKAAFPLAYPFAALLPIVDDRSHAFAGEPVLARREKESVVYEDDRLRIIDLAQFSRGTVEPIEVTSRRPWRRMLPLGPAKETLPCTVSLRLRRKGSGVRLVEVNAGSETIAILRIEGDDWQERSYSLVLPAVPLTSPPIPQALEVRVTPPEAEGSIEVVPGAVMAAPPRVALK